MKTTEIKIKTKNEASEALEATVTYDLPETLQEAVEKFGETAIFDLVTQQLSTNVGNIARAALRDGDDPQEAASGYVPGQKRPRGPVDPMQQAMSAFSKMTNEQKMSYLADLKAKMGL